MKVLIIIVLSFIELFIFFIWQNNDIIISNYNYESNEIPFEFNDFKIVQISDLHNKMFGKEQSKLLEKIEKLSPDIIIITGDLIDRRRYNLDKAMYFIKGAVKIAPTYYVSGNHEAWSGKYAEIKEGLTESGVHIIDDEMLEIKKGRSFINFLGLSDPAFITSSYIDGTDTSKLEKYLNSWSDIEGFKILLSHRPELFDLYCEYNINMIFSGHAHGGQIRIPFIGGVIAPNQGFLPKYTSGSYSSDKTTMFVSRGLGNSVFPVRVFNRPEIISVTLKAYK
ncbi:phosphoesterase [Clostridium sartagoforme AAU1]|uniref:Phosphoesterase n=1 Tax=Clostridium sartagoforme AAU1 TaxID=1202534 RepID=R9CBH1_9CLOT|nr:metallophosphoesterase [Clostridium sartagoforme]EOR26335.1 phosphoesterase [Clostridium sartagoforme AAU1]